LPNAETQIRYHTHAERPVDYERTGDENNRRLSFFGRHAGLPGMINKLWSLGKRLEVEGVPSAFSRLK